MKLFDSLNWVRDTDIHIILHVIPNNREAKKTKTLGDTNY